MGTDNHRSAEGEKLTVRAEVEGHLSDPSSHRWLWGTHPYNVISPSLMSEAFFSEMPRVETVHRCLSVYLTPRLCYNLGCPDS